MERIECQKNKHAFEQFRIAVEVVFISMSIFYDFSICFVSFYSVYYFWESIILSCEFTLSKRKKNLRKCGVYMHSHSDTSISLHLHLYANYPSFGSFRWRQKYRLWFLRCLPFWAPCLFWRSGFFRLCFRLIISKFQGRKVIRNAVTE